MKTVHKITYSALFLALGLVLPFLTGQLQQFGNMLLPMHFPVFLCGLICGWKYGLLVGFLLPLFRSLILQAPPMYPVAIGMAAELAAYGFVVGFLYEKRPWKCLKSLYISLVSAMIAGRIIWGLAYWILLCFGNKAFTLKMFFVQSVVNAVPGIILQLILIPILMLSLRQTKFVAFCKHKEKNNCESR